MRDKKRSCEATKYAQTGWCWSNSIKFLDQHHPVASRHPSSAEEGTLLLSVNSFTASITAPTIAAPHGGAATAGFLTSAVSN